MLKPLVAGCQGVYQMPVISDEPLGVQNLVTTLERVLKQPNTVKVSSVN